MAVTDARVKFLRGLKANLPNTLTDGNVYIATDERAMYVDYLPAGAGATLTRIRIGDIIEYANYEAIQALPTSSLSTSALYYAIAENALIKWDGTTWKQINSQDISNIIKSMTWSITGSDGATANVLLSITKPNNTYAFDNTLLYRITSTQTDALKVTVSSVTQGTQTIPVIRLNPKSVVTNTELGTVTSGYSDNSVVLSLYKYETGTDSSGNAVTRPSNLAAASTITFEGANAAHVKSTNSGTVTIGVNLQIEKSFDANGKLTTALKDTISQTYIGTDCDITPGIQIGHAAASQVTRTFANGTAVLDVYTAAEVDTILANSLKSINAMTFKGSLGLTSNGGIIQTLPLGNTTTDASTVRIGDTYKVVTADTYVINNNNTNNEQGAIVGDLFIATSVDGEEDSDGFIPASKIRWVYIPSGDDSVSYLLAYDSTDQQITLNSSNVRTGLALKFNTTNGLSIANSGAGTSQTVTLSHTTYSTTSSTNTDGDVTKTFGNSGNSVFTAITGLTVSNGHVTGYSTSSFTLGSLKFVDYNSQTPANGSNIISKLYNGNSAIAASSNSSSKTTRAMLIQTLKYQDNTSLELSVPLASESLTFRKTTNTDAADLLIDLLWETF